MTYFIYTILNLGCTYVVYRLVLRNQKTFQFNRFFLIVSLILCFLSPIIEIEIFKTVPSLTELSFDAITSAPVINDNINNTDESASVNAISPKINYLWYVYLLICLIFLIRFIKNFFELVGLASKSKKRFGRFKVVEIEDSMNTSSFFNLLFTNQDLLMHSKESVSIIRHELVHYKHCHSLDVIISELFLCFFWFNPFVWLYKIAIIQNHEFIADYLTIKSGIDVEKYSQTIINSGNQKQTIQLTSSFNFTQIKNRIHMLQQSKSRVFRRTIKIVLALLLFIGIVAFSSFKKSSEKFIVVIDAGHGGHDDGNLNEKEIVLNVSKMLKSLSNDKLEIITTRDSDVFLTLNERIDFINKQNPDLVISLHCNSNTNIAKSGIEAYYYESDNFEQYSMSMEYGSFISSKLLELGFSEVRLSPANFVVLRELKSPAFLLQLGFLTNESDNLKLNDIATQKDIAKLIYDGMIGVKR